MNLLDRLVKMELQDLYNERWRKKLDELSAEDNNLFTMARALVKKRTVLSPIHDINGILYSVAEKAETFADSMTNNFVKTKISSLMKIGRKDPKNEEIRGPFENPN